MSINHFSYLKYVLPRRRRLQALSLRVDGRPRVNRLWPQLAGLDNASNEYHRRYKALRKEIANERPA